MLDWFHLLNSERQRTSNKKADDKRTEFERDFDRVIYSSSFRRLKDKTQVFPLERDDFVRTRLTHSLEVSSLGRSFGLDVIRTLEKKGKLKKGEVDEGKVAAILSTACLLHDIGNPPFGHFGEESIRSWFRKYFGEKRPSLTDAERKDFEEFEGNAQGLRVVTFTQALDDRFGLNLTYGTLASLIKYPCSSDQFDEKLEKKSRSKFGFFQTEKNVFEAIQSKTGLNNNRHPLVFLLEAADDIAFSAIDVEDSLRKKAVPYELFCENMLKALKEPRDKKLVQDFNKERHKLSKEGWYEEQANRIAIQKFRIEATGLMFRDCVESFIQNYEQIMNGTFENELIKKSKSANLYSTLRKFAREHVYTLPTVLMLEMIGHRVIHGLLEAFVPAVESGRRGELRTEDGKLFELISPGLRNLVVKFGDLDHQKDRLHLVTDFISGMTDNYALDLYRKLTGMKIELGS